MIFRLPLVAALALGLSSASLHAAPASKKDAPAAAAASATDAKTTASPDELLQAADRARGAAVEGISWNIKVDSIEGANKEKNTVAYRVKAKGQNALAEASEPARHKGETMLFNDRSLWFFKPGLKKPVSISARQKLMGQASNGDIASTNYFRDYDGKVVGEDLIDGKAAWKLELKAKAKNVTYDGIRYWISKDTQVGVKAEFLTVSGEVFKTATFTYGNNVTLAGKQYPFISVMTIVDALDSSKSTVITYDKPQIETHSDFIFNINNLVR